MKYYGFRFKTFIVEKSKLNGHVSTWIGLIGTFLFIVSAAESGGFKGRIGDELWLTIVYPAILWFLCLLAVEHRWAKIVIILASGVAILFALLVNVFALVYKSRYDLLKNFGQDFFYS